MTTYIIRRIIYAILTLIFISMAIFFAMRMLPGGSLLLFINQSGMRQLTEEEYQIFLHKYGLDRSLPVQYVGWLSDVLRGDFGTSVNMHVKVNRLLAQSIPVSLILGISALIISSILGMLAGTLAAIRRGTWIDTLMTSLANIV